MNLPHSVEQGLMDEGLGRASLGGFINRGSAIPWLQGKFVQGDFAVDLLNGQIFVAEPPTEEASALWSLERAYVFNATDPVYSGFVKSIGQDADGELYAITGAFTPTGLIGRVFKNVGGANRTTPSPTMSGDSNSMEPTMSPMTPPSATSGSAQRSTICVLHIMVGSGILFATHLAS